MLCVFCRCFDLPHELFEIILEYIPYPRMWNWSINRLNRRINLSSHVSTYDMCVLIDEMLKDMSIFSSHVGNNISDPQIDVEHETTIGMMEHNMNNNTCLLKRIARSYEVCIYLYTIIEFYLEVLIVVIIYTIYVYVSM